MCDKIEELEKKIADLERTNDLLRTLVKKKDARIQELREDYDELNDISIELTEENNELKKANDILTEECNNALMLNDKHGGEAKDLKKENEKLKRACNAYVQENLDLYKAKEKLENENESLKVTIHGYIQENLDLYKAKEKLENENKQLQYYVDDWKDRSETNQNLFERSCDHVTRLEKENEDLKKQLANALDLYDERGEVIEKHEELKSAIKTILNFVCGVDTDGDKIKLGVKTILNSIYGVDTDGDKIEHLERENESLRKTNANLVNRFGGETDCIIRSIMVNGGKI